MGSWSIPTPNRGRKRATFSNRGCLRRRGSNETRVHRRPSTEGPCPGKGGPAALSDPTESPPAHGSGRRRILDRSGYFHRRGQPVVGAELSIQRCPKGSWMTAIRPWGVSSGPRSRVAPRSLARRTVSSTSATARCSDTAL